jgi:hypothetical protein
MTTVKELIEELKQVKDQEQIIIAEYYTKESFCFDLDGPQTVATEKEFAKVAEKVNRFGIFENTAQEINEIVFTEIAKRDN